MCLYPKLIKNPKYKSTKKNGGIIPAVPDERVKLVPIGCQECMECRKQKARSWQLRLLEHIKTNTNGKFITLTFSNEAITKLYQELKPLKGYELDNAAATLALRRFNERWRRKFIKALPHWIITELGHKGTENIHMHGILWTNESYATIEERWNAGEYKYGYIWPKPQQYNNTYVNARTVNYIIKYVHKMDIDHPNYKSIVLTSPGIGNNYTKTSNALLNKFKGTETIETYRTSTGHKIAMPIYWRNKIYSEEQREKLWLQKLDKQLRYICGEKIDVSKNMNDYYATLEHYRRKNKQLGYGDDQKNWTQKKYEEERRQLLQQKRTDHKPINKYNTDGETIIINNNYWLITSTGLTHIE